MDEKELKILIPSETVREYMAETGWEFTDFQKAVNGREGSFYDPWANDQDWGLYFNLKELGTGYF